MRFAIQPLDASIHDRGAFSCGTASIDRYLREIAAQAAVHFRSGTRVLVQVDQPKTILGFHTICQLEFRDEEMDPTTARALKIQNLKRIPAVLLGQLAVAATCQGQGLGRMLLDDAFKKALYASCILGGALLVTDPIDEKARSFYLHYEFQELQGAGERLFMAMKTLEAAYPAVVKAARAAVAKA